MGLILLLMVLVACGIVGSKENDNKIKASNDTGNELSNEELINLAIQEFKEYSHSDLFSFCLENATVEDVREATDIKIWEREGRYIEISVDTEVNNGDVFDGSKNYTELYELVDGELEETDNPTEEKSDDVSVKILSMEPDYMEENDSVLDVTKTTQCD
ncbi:hypothetical protein [Oceanobacillus polygoni]|uniref:Uncharacterized protein n=2 Tax=Oceanobacillus polygoni TaxID=1235259 RepID=A0A9X0YVZ2_9BACI|nr:hypothetical protein [Oceanobacillus polygoni]MBP2079654.1 hypothetical protein [Oceanobacillus polygoni]